jgi:hypothetical protein
MAGLRWFDMADKYQFIANRVFIGCPWKTVKAKYERAIDKAQSKYPLSFILIGKETDQSAEDLLSVIQKLLFSSSEAIFDATGGNANVSLEYGMAIAKPIKSTLYLSSNKRSSNAGDSPIISDIAGRRRKHYSNERRLKALFDAFAGEHPYTKRFESFLKKAQTGKGISKHRFRILCLKVIHQIDWKDDIRCAEVVNNLKAAEYTDAEIEMALLKLRNEGLIKITRGNASSSKMSISI